MDTVFKILEIHLEQQKYSEINEDIAKCKKLLEEGGDWERKTKLKVYEGIYGLLVRNFKLSINLFIDVLPTFNSPEIITMENLVRYTVLISLITLPRDEIKKKIVHSPDVNSVIRNIKDLKPFLDSFY